MKKSDWLQLVGLSIVFGSTFLFFALALQSITPMTIALTRVALAASVFWVLILVFRVPLPRGRRVWGAFLVMGLINNAIPFSLIAWEQTQIEGGLASIMNATTSCFAVVLAHFLTRDERLSAKKVVGVLVGFFGVYVLMRPELGSGITMRGWGQVAGLGASFFLALAGIYGKRFKELSPMVICQCSCKRDRVHRVRDVPIVTEGRGGRGVLHAAFLQLHIQRQTADLVGQHVETGRSARLQRVFALDH